MEHSDQPQAEPLPPLTHEEIDSAVKLADWSISREGFNLRNPHDLNNLRQLVYGLAMPLRKFGREGIHVAIQRYQQVKIEPLAYQGILAVVRELKIELSPEDLAIIDAAKNGLNKEKDNKRQQPEDIHIDMAELKKQILPLNLSKSSGGGYHTQHTPARYREKLIAEGSSIPEAEVNTAWLVITLNRIGLSMRRFKPTHNNPVEFLDMAVDRVLAHNRRLEPSSTPASLEQYVREWKNEVKHTYMGVRDPQEVRAAMQSAIIAVTEPSRQKRPKLSERAQRQKDAAAALSEESQRDYDSTSGLRFFRDHMDSKSVKVDPSKSHKQAVELLTMLAIGYQERHDITRYLQSFLAGDIYQKKLDQESRQVITRALQEFCNNLVVDYPAGLSKEPQVSTQSWQDLITKQQRLLTEKGKAFAQGLSS